LGNKKIKMDFAIMKVGSNIMDFQGFLPFETIVNILEDEYFVLSRKFELRSDDCYVYQIMNTKTFELTVLDVYYKDFVTHIGPFTIKYGNLGKYNSDINVIFKKRKFIISFLN